MPTTGGIDSRPASLPALAEETAFAIQMAGPHSSADVATVVQAIDDLAVGAIWGTLVGGFGDAENSSDLDLIHQLRAGIGEAYDQSFASDEGSVAARLVRTALSERPSEVRTDGADAEWVLTTFSATNQWLKRDLFDRDVEFYSQIFSFAQVTEARHSSPLVVVVVLAPAVGIAGAAWLAAMAIRWIYRVRQERAEARSAEAQTRIDLVRARLVEQAERDLSDRPELREAVSERVIERLLPAAETLIEHPAIESVEVRGEGVA